MFVAGQTINPYPLVRTDLAPRSVNGIGCGCSAMQKVGQVAPTAPAGIGAADRPLLFGTVTGYTIGDALLVGALGYFAAPRPTDRAFWAAGGAVAGAMAGTFGLAGLLGAALWVRKPTTQSAF
jgi:hypothetical protein